MIDGKKIKFLRELHKMTRRDLSIKAEVGIATVYRLEKGEGNLTTLTKIARALGVKLETFLREGDQ